MDRDRCATPSPPARAWRWPSPASASSASPAIRPALTRLVGLVRARVPLDRALLALSAELNDASADKVIGALILNVRQRGTGLAAVLTSLAAAGRAELDQRRRVSAGRASMRRSVQLVVIITLLFAVFLVIFSQTYVKPYASVSGQVTLGGGRGAVLGGVPLDAEAGRRGPGAAVPEPRRDRDRRRGPAGHRAPHRSQSCRRAGADQQPAENAGDVRGGGAAMIAMTLVGVAFGAALFLLILQVRPPTPDPLVMLARYDQAQAASPRRSETSVAKAGAGAETRLGRWVAGELARRGITYTSLRQDLALNGQSFESTMGRKVVVAVVGFLVGLVIAVSLGVAGLRLSVGVPVVVGLLFAAGVLLHPRRRRPHRGRAPPQGVQARARRIPGLGVAADEREGRRRAGAARRGQDRQRLAAGPDPAHRHQRHPLGPGRLGRASPSSVTGSACRSCASSAPSCSWSPTTARRSATPSRRARRACVTRSWPTPRAPPANGTSRC